MYVPPDYRCASAAGVSYYTPKASPLGGIDAIKSCLDARHACDFKNCCRDNSLNKRQKPAQCT